MNWKEFKPINGKIIGKKINKTEKSGEIYLVGNSKNQPNFATVLASPFEDIPEGSTIVVDEFAGTLEYLNKGEGGHRHSTEDMFLVFSRDEVLGIVTDE